MIINDELIEQWEPQVHKIARTMSIIGMDYDDIVQELRMGVMKAAKGYKEDSGVIFHTYILYCTLGWLPVGGLGGGGSTGGGCVSHIGCIGIRHKIPPLPYRGATIVPRPPRAGPPGYSIKLRKMDVFPPGGGCP
jgi:hypothetical protein